MIASATFGRRMPRIEGEWWTVATSPSLGTLTSEKQQPVDFGIWQADDGTWQLWSCIRGTREPGNTRLFYRWEGRKLTEPEWTPKGIAMHADPTIGETTGGLQAPFVTRNLGGSYLMFYGDWENICSATSPDGVSFMRRLTVSGRPSLFSEGTGTNTRDPMVLRINGLWHCYYTAFPNSRGAVYCRTSTDTLRWSSSRIVASGGRAGTGRFASECPFVVQLGEKEYYLFRTQRYGTDAVTSVYCSDDPLRFGENEDRRYFIGTLPVAAPEIILHSGEYYIAALLPSLKGIRIARLHWEPRPQQPASTP